MRGETTRVGKRPLRSLTAIEKISAIRRVHEGESKASVARDLSVPESTLRGWCKSEHKIRGMARNSSTPDSNEAHSPLSTSGNNNNNLSMNTSLIGGNHSSEDEGTSLSKRPKIEPNIYQAANLFTNENLENLETSRLIDSSSSVSAAAAASKIDYASLVASMTGIAGLRPENNAFLLQQLGLLGGASGALAKNLLNYQSVLPHTSTVGLVENGLQYTKSGNNNNINNNNNNNNNNNSNKRHSTSAIAPAQLETMSKSYTRKSSPPAAEIPLTVDPASPRKTSDLLHHHHHQNNNIHSHQNNNNISHHHHSNNNNNNNNQNHRETKRQNTQIPSLNNNKKVDEALWLWLTSQQQQLQGATGFNPNQSQQDAAFRSWFWQWYKQLDSPLLPLPQQQQQQQQQQVVNGKKSPTKTRALLDSVLCNNNDNVRKSMNGVFDVFNNDDHHFVNDGSGAMNMTIPPPQTAALPLTTTTPAITTTAASSTSPTPAITSEEAIEHGEKFFKWLNKCSEPAVSRLQIMQFKYLLDNLKTCKKNIKSSHSKQRRK